MNLRCYQWIMYAQMDGICSKTGKEIRVGDIILYLPPVKRGKRFICGGRVFHKDSDIFKKATKLPDTAWKIKDEDQIW